MKKAFILALWSLCVSVLSDAQQLDNPTSVPLSFKVYGYARSFDLNCDEDYPYECEPFTVEATIAGVTSQATGDDPGWVGGSWVTAQLTPGRLYTVGIGFGGGSDAKMKFSAPDRHTLYINGKKSEVLEAGFDPGVTVRLVPDEPLASGPAAAASALLPGKLGWGVSVGFDADGRPAGYIGLLDAAIQGSSFTPSALFLSTESAEVERLPQTGVLRQIRSPQAVADISAITADSYSIKFYTVAQITGTSGGYYTFNGTPFVTYTIQKDGSPIRLKIVKAVGAKSWHTIVEKSSEDWTVTDWHRTGTTATRVVQSDFSIDGLTEIRTEGDGVVVATKSQFVYANYGWGREIVSSTAGYGESEAIVSTYAYYTDANLKGSYGKLKSVTSNDGSWVKYEYYEDELRIGMLKELHEPWLDFPSTLPSDASIEGKVTTFDYDYDWTGEKKDRLRLQETRVKESSTATQRMIAKRFNENGIENSQAWVKFNGGSKNYLPLRVASTHDYASGSDSVETTVMAFDENASDFYRGKTYAVIGESGFAESYAYLTGTFDANTLAFTIDGSTAADDTMTVRFTGSWQGGGVLISQYGVTAMEQGLEPIYCIDGKSTRTHTIRSADGRWLYTASYIYDGSDFRFAGGELTKYSALGFVEERKNVFATNMSGSSFNKVITYDATIVDGEVISERDAAGVETTFEYHPSGALKKKIHGSAPAWNDHAMQQSVTTEYGYDAAGRTTRVALGFSSPIEEKWEYDKAGRLTKHSVPGNNNGTFAWSNTLYTYDVDLRKRTATNPLGGTTIETSYRDGSLKEVAGTAQPPRYFTRSVQSSGNILTESKPTSTSIDRWVKTEADWLGRAVAVTTPTFLHPNDATATRIDKSVYDAVGRLAYTYSHSGQSGSPRLSPNYRFEYGYMGEVIKEGLDIDLDGVLEDASYDRFTVHSIDAITSSNDIYLKRVAETFAFENSATKTKLWEKRARLTGLDGASLAGEEWIYDGNNNATKSTVSVSRANKQVLVTTDHPDASAHSYEYLYNGRRSREVDAANSQTKYHYNSHGLAYYVSGRDSVSEIRSYYSGTPLVYQTKDSQDKITGRYYYDIAGNVTQSLAFTGGTWLTARYSYNVNGTLDRQWGDAVQPARYTYNGFGQRTYMFTYRGGSNWNSTTWPSTTGASDTAEWHYQDRTGLLRWKEDDEERNVLFEYNLRGQLTKRVSPRSGVTTSYIYYEDETGVHPSDFTGELKTIDYSGGSGSVDVTYKYARSGKLSQIYDYTGWRSFSYRASDLQLEKEALPVFYGGSGSDPAVVTPRYETAPGAVGRYDGTQFGKLSSPSSSYFKNVNYDSTTGRLGFIYGSSAFYGGRSFDYTYRTNTRLVKSIEWSNDENYVRTYNWSPTRNVLDSIEYQFDGDLVSRYVCGYDYADRKEFSKFSGPFASYQGLSYGWQADYDHTSRGEIDDVTVYQLNSSGAKTSTEIASRRRDYNYDNGSNRSLKTSGTASSNTYAINNLNQVTSVSGPEADSLQYDEEGNLTSDALHTYSYDGQNRLTLISRKDGTDQARYYYDYLGRMVMRLAYFWDDDDDVLRTDYVNSRRYLYEGWNLTVEMDYYRNVTKAFTWGPSMQGLGGVGALLMVETPIIKDYPIYDDRGNVVGLVNNGGGLAAYYDYDAYGELVASGGSHADACPFGFATKFRDPEFGIIYYGHRFYSPKLGRFLNRDPLGEAGGLNPYAMAGNDPVGSTDYLGLLQVTGASNASGGSIPRRPSSGAWWDGENWQTDREDMGEGHDFLGMYGMSAPSIADRHREVVQFVRHKDENGRVLVGYLPDLVKAGKVDVPWLERRRAPAQPIIGELEFLGWDDEGGGSGDAAMDTALNGFVFGSSDLNRQFDGTHPWTQDLQNHPHLNDVRREIVRRVVDGGGNNVLGITTNANFSLNNQTTLTNARIFLRDVAAGFQLTSSAHSMGSFRLTYTVTGAGPNGISVSFQANDALRLGSATRVPMTNKSALQFIAVAGLMQNQGMNGSSYMSQAQFNAVNQILSQDSSSVDEPFGAGAPFNTVNLQWNWTETVQY